MVWYKDKIFWSIICAAILTRLAAFAWLLGAHPLGEQVLIFPDSLGYVYPAQTLLTYGHLWEAVSATPLLLRTPGYPVFLALIHWISGNVTWAVAVAQNILAVCMLWPVYLSTRRLGGINAARWASGFCAISVLYFSLSFAVLTETLCTFLLAWFVFFLLRWLDKPRRQNLTVAAVLLVAAVYVRPAAYYFVPVTWVLAFAWAQQKKSFSLAKQIIFCLLLPTVILLGAWQIRNYVQTGYRGFSTVGAYNLYMWNEDYVAKQNNLSVMQAHQQLQKELPPGFENFSAAQQVKTYKRLAAPLVARGLIYKLVHVPHWAVKTLFGTNYAHVTRLAFGQENSPATTLNQTQLLPRPWINTPADKGLFALVFLQVAMVVLVGSWGLWCCFKTHRAAAVFLTVYTVYFWAIGSCFFGAYARFRAPFEFVLCITAGLTMQTWYKKLCPATPAGAQGIKSTDTGR
ncbi:MAG: glycosyltransferase family 39 protein [Elusimicrobiaceae bacterium]|nr:glycosyltransferase family 39 protein [Elusimicrobiaceae bacterium]